MRGIGRSPGEIGSLLAVLALAGACETNGLQSPDWHPEIDRPPEREAHEDWTPVALSFLPGIQAFSGARDVRGLRLALIAGLNRNVSGIDLSPLLMSMTLGDETGLQATGGINLVTGNARGIQLGGVANRVDGTLTGIQVSSFFNLAAEKIEGTQIGAINVALSDVAGVQMELFNWGEPTRGIQIGLLNYNSRALLPVFPLVNFCFHGQPPARATQEGPTEGTRKPDSE